MTQQVTLTGKATRAPELSFTNGGKGLAKFGLAVERSWGQGSDKQKTVSFFEIICWGSLGENVAASVQKGDNLVVEGRIEVRPWEDRDGNKRTSTEVTANDVGMSMLWNVVECLRTERSKPQSPPEPEPPMYPDDEPF